MSREGTNGPPVYNGAPYTYSTQSLSSLRDDLLTMLGFPDPLTGIDSETQQLVWMREQVIRRVGHSYFAGANAPGVDELVDSFINEAQQTLFRTAELDKGGTAFPAHMTSDTDPTEIDYKPILDLAIGLYKAHLGHQDASAYFESMQKYLQDRTTRRPPNIVDMCTKWLQKAQEKLYQKYKVLRREMWWEVPITQGNRFYDVPSVSSGGIAAATVFDNTAKTITRSDIGGSWIDDGFKVGDRVKGYGADNSGNNLVQWTITALTATVMTLDAADVLVDETSTGTVYINTANWRSLDFRHAIEVWLKDNNVWIPLREGRIPAAQFSTRVQTVPSFYELREFFEVYPTPNKSYSAYIKGHMGLKPFTADTDEASIDPEAVLLQALAWGKMHFGQPDAMMWTKEARDMVAHLNAGSYAGKSYIPDPERVVRLASYPDVTFPRT